MKCVYLKWSKGEAENERMRHKADSYLKRDIKQRNKM
jgi:hypothetical protein